MGRGVRDVRRVTAALRRWSLGGDLGAWPARGPGAFRALATLHGSHVAREVVDRGSGHEIVPNIYVSIPTIRWLRERKTGLKKCMTLLVG